MQEFHESLQVGENRMELQSRASSYTQISCLSKPEAVNSKGIHSPNKYGHLTAEQLEIIRLQSENFDLRRLCERLQHTASNSAEEVAFCNT